MPPKKSADLTDHVKECMISLDNDVPSARKQLQQRRKDEVRELYNTRSVPTKEARDPARAVLHNVYHQQVEKDTKVPVVYKLLAHHFGSEGGQTLPVSHRPPPTHKDNANPCGATQTIVCEPEPVATPPQSCDPKMEEILAKAKSARPKSSLGVAHYDKSTGREVKSVGVHANPSDIIRATMRSTSRPSTAGASVPKPAWTTMRNTQTNTDLQWERSLGEVPKMGSLTLKVLNKPLPQELQPGPRAPGARHAHRPRDTMFVF